MHRVNDVEPTSRVAYLADTLLPSIAAAQLGGCLIYCARSLRERWDGWDDVVTDGAQQLFRLRARA